MFTDPAVLPFRLELCEGEGAHTRRIPMEIRHTRMGTSWEPVAITENLPLSLELVQGDVQVEITWGDRAEWDDVEDEALNDGGSIFLSPEVPRHILVRTGEVYPWCCGMYRFQIHCAGKNYAGMFEVVPRHLSESQLRHMHEVIRGGLKGLVDDYFSLRQFGRNGVSLEEVEVPQWQFFVWYQGMERKLLHAIKGIEVLSEVELKESYVMESVMKRQTAKSVRWMTSARGIRVQGTQSYNRRMVLHTDSGANRWIKAWIRAILLKMQQAIHSLHTGYDIIAEAYDETVHTIELEKQKLAAFSKNRRISRSDQYNLKNTISIDELKLKKTTEKLALLQRAEQAYRGYQSGLRRVLASDFWRDVGDVVPTRFTIGSNQAYRQVYTIWKEAMSWGNPGLNHSLPGGISVTRPTSLLYEYYILFTAVNVFIKIGFSIASDNLNGSFGDAATGEGLRQGTKIRLIRDGDEIELSYDEMVENQAASALERRTHFFSNEYKRQPDVRIDRYKRTPGGGRLFRSMFILEVKYRPFWNIYSDQGNTETMIQLSKYYAIRHVDVREGRKHYHRNPVHQVICCYPGAAAQELLTETGCGLFLQLYPDQNGETVGLDVLQSEFQRWLDGVVE